MNLELTLRTEGVVKAIVTEQSLRGLTDEQLAVQLELRSPAVWRLVKIGTMALPASQLRQAARFLRCDLRLVVLAFLNQHSPTLKGLVEEAFDVLDTGSPTELGA
jgi:hypothetical protein